MQYDKVIEAERIGDVEAISTPAEQAYFLAIPVQHVADYLEHLRQQRIAYAATKAFRQRHPGKGFYR